VAYGGKCWTCECNVENQACRERLVPASATAILALIATVFHLYYLAVGKAHLWIINDACRIFIDPLPIWRVLRLPIIIRHRATMTSDNNRIVGLCVSWTSFIFAINKARDRCFKNAFIAAIRKQKLGYRKQIARQLRTQYVQGIDSNHVTLKSRLRITQGHWKWCRSICDNTTFCWSAVVTIAPSCTISSYFALNNSWPWYLGYKSLKVIETGTIWKLACDFLIAFHSKITMTLSCIVCEI